MASERKNNKWLGYTIYVVVVAALLLYLLFPGQAVDEFLDNNLRRINPEYAFRAEKIQGWLPPAIRITAAEIYLKNQEEQAVFDSDVLYIKPKVLDLVRGERRFGLVGTAYSGDMNGSLHFTDADNGLFKSEITVRNFNLAEYDLLVDKFKHSLTGSISGEIEYGRESAGSAGGSGRADLRLIDGQLRFNKPILNVVSLDLQNIRLEAELSRRTVTIVKADLSGPEVNGSLNGSIELQKDIGLSQLNLKGSLEPLAEFYKNHPEIRELLKAMKKRVRRGQYFFTVTGTLDNPKFKLL